MPSACICRALAPAANVAEGTTDAANLETPSMCESVPFGDRRFACDCETADGDVIIVFVPVRWEHQSARERDAGRTLHSTLSPRSRRLGELFLPIEPASV